MKSYVDLYVAAASTSAAVSPVGRIDTAISGLMASNGKTRKVVSLIARCNNVGYLAAMLNGKVLATFDMAILHALTVPLDLDIDVPVGGVLSFQAISSSGTNSVSVTIGFTE